MADAGFCRIIEVGDGSTTKMHSPVFRDTLETSHAIDLHSAGQIIATSHDLTPNSGLVREIPLFQGNLGW